MIAAPLFLISNPELVIAQCKAGIVGSFPALNARGADRKSTLEEWLVDIKSRLDDVEGAYACYTTYTHRIKLNSRTTLAVIKSGGA